MADSNNRIRIDFDVNAKELAEITKAIGVLDKFNKQATQLVNAMKQVSNAQNNSSQSSKKQQQAFVNVTQAMNAWNKQINQSQTTIKSYEAAQAKLTQQLSKYGRDVKVVIDQNGRVSASFKNAEGNVVSMKGKYDQATDSIKKMQTNLSSVSNEVTKKAAADRKAAQEMNRLHGEALKLNRELENQKKKYQELTRGTDLSRVLKANGNSFDVFNNAVKQNATVVRASIDRNGKFSQTLRMQDGTLRSISGYYDKVNKKLVQYSESMGKAESSTRKMAGQAHSLNQLNGIMQGLTNSTQSFAEAVNNGVHHILLFKAAGGIILGLQSGFRQLLSTLVEIDTQVTQLMRVLPETTNFNEMMSDAIGLSTELGRTITDINEGLITFARSGFNNIDTRFLTEAATLMANVSDINVTDASESITSAITLFNIKARDSIQVVNKLNEVDNDYSVSTEQLAKSITRAGGTAASFGVSLEELIGHTTAIGVATRESGQIIGNSLKTIYSRINTLPKAAKAIEDMGISMTLANGDNRDVADIMDDVAKKWPELNNAKKQSAAIDIAGTYQLSRFLAMMNNYQMGLDATKTAQHSYNSAVKENEKYMKSIQARINLVKSSFEQLAMALGKAGLAKIMIVALEAVNNLVQGFTKLVDVMGKWTFAIPLAAAAISIFIAQFQRTKREMLAFQLAMVTMNTNMSRTAFAMSASATSGSILNATFAALRTGALGLTAALMTNPLTWITVALTVVPMLIGHFQRLKAEHDALMKKAEDNTKAFKDFKKEIADKKVNETSLDVFKSKAEVAEKALGKLYDAQDKITDSQAKAKKVMNELGGEYQMMSQKVIEQTNWQDALSKKTKEELADIGIKYDKYKSMNELMDAVKGRQKEYSDAVSAGQSVLKDQEKQLAFNADAFDEVGESVQETMDIMQTFFGVNDQMVQEMIGAYNSIMVLTKVKKLDENQTAMLEQAYGLWEARLGVTRDELLKHPELMKKNITWQEKMKEKWGETTQGVLTAEQQRRLASDITTQKVKENAQTQAEADRVAQAQRVAHEKKAAEERAKAAEAEAKRKAAAFSQTVQNMGINKALNLGMTQEEVANATLRGNFAETASKKIGTALQSEDAKTQSTSKAYQEMQLIQKNSHDGRWNSMQKSSTEIMSQMGIERQKSKDTGTAYSKMQGVQDAANKNRLNTQTNSTSGIKKALSSEGTQAGNTATSHSNASTKVIKASKNQKDNVISNALQQSNKHKAYSKSETGSVISGWDTMWNKISSIMGWIKNLFGIKSSSNKSNGGATKQYANGTSASGHIGGPAIVGEEGPELAHIPNQGTTIVGARGPEMINLPKGTSVLPNKHTEKLLKSYGFPAYAGGVGDFFDAITKGPKAVWESGLSKFGLTDSILPSWFTKMSGSPIQYLTKMAVSKVDSMLESALGAFGNFSGGGAKMATAVITQALRITGQSMSWLPFLMTVAQRESGFNPRAINLWDSNAKKGTPSKGMFQTIDPTFNAYKLGGMNNIWNPLHNAVAAIRYMLGRYGGIGGHPAFRSMANGGGYKPYANGGFIDRPHMGLVGEAGPEAIIPLSSERRSRALKLYQQVGQQLGVRAYANGGIVGGTYTVKAGDTLGELAKQFKTTVKNLMAMNKSIKDSNKIYAGQKLKVGSSGSSSGSKTTKNTKPQTKAEKEKAEKAKKAKADKAKAIQEKADNAVQKNKSYMSYMQGLGLRNDSTYTTWKLKDKRSNYVKASTENKRDYNTQYSEALKKYTNVSDAKKSFKNAGFFGLDKSDKDKLWKEIEKSVKANIVAKNDEKAGKMNSYVDYMQSMGAKGYDTPQYMTWKLKENESTFKGASAETQKDYNTQMAQALSDYDNLEEARKKFESAAWFGLNQKQKDSVWAGIEEAVKSNAFEALNEKTSTWLDTFNSGLKEASDKVKNIVSLNESLKQQQEDMAKTKYVNSSVSKAMDAAGFGDNLTEEEKIKQRMDEIKQEAETRLTQNAEISWAADPTAIKNRKNELQKQMTTLNEQIQSTAATATKNGLSGAKYDELMKPLKDKYQELLDEYNSVDAAAAGNSDIFNKNKDAVSQLSDEYAKLQAQLGSTTEKYDEFGNVVRSLNGQTATGITGASSVVSPVASNYQYASPTSSINGTSVVPSYNVAAHDSAKEGTYGELKTYQADLSRGNSTYVVQAGLVVGTQSELKEFAMIIKGMVEEEEGRSKS